MAGGFELMQATDIVIVSDDAKIADNHINFGMIPGGGSTQRLPRLIGHQLALGLLLSGERLSGLAGAAVTTLAARLGIETPICEAVRAILAGEVAVTPAINALLARPLKAEG